MTSRLPTIDEVRADPTILAQYPAPIILEYIRQLEALAQKLDGAANVPDTPVELALLYPRFAWMNTPHIHYLGDQIRDVVHACTSIVVMMPPQHAKSTSCSIWTAFWYLVLNPDRRVLLISYEKNFARRWGRAVRDLVLEHGREYGLEVNPKVMAGDDWDLLTGGGMTTVGVGGPISGRYIGLMIVDDAIKNYEEAHSSTIRESTWDWWEGTAMQRIQPDTATIVIGTRYHEDDLIGRLLRGSADGTGHPFAVCKLPALAEAGDPLGRALGEGLWLNGPGSKGQDFYLRTRAAISAYRWSSIYQQNPTAPGGNTINPEWWRYYYPNQLPQLTKSAISVDLALDSVKKSDSYQTALVGGTFGSYLYLRDAFHEHCGYGAAQDGVKILCKTYPEARTKIVERAITGPALISTLNVEIGGFIAWPPKGHRKGSKEANLDACIPMIRSGNVWLPVLSDGNKPKWVQEFTLELQQFPRSVNDDYVDTFAQIAQFLVPGMRLLEQKVGRAHTEALESAPEAFAERQARALQGMLAQLAAEKMRRLVVSGKVMAEPADLDRGGHSSGLLPFGRHGPARIGPVPSSTVPARMGRRRRLMG